MRNNVNSQAKRFSKRRRFRHRWQRVVTCLAAVVVFCTTYALILPAITLTEEPICGCTEHVHDASCYQTPEPVISCALELHQHDASCRDADNALVCGYADFAVHQHTGICYDSKGNLLCGLGEAYTHTHGEACYEIVVVETAAPQPSESVPAETVPVDETVPTETVPAETEPVQTEPVQTERRLICSRTELTLHSHADSCFGAEGKPVCGMLQVQEHVHTDACLKLSLNEEDLICTLPVDVVDENGALHTHTEACYGVLVCGLEEHTHDKVLCFSDPDADVETAEDWTKTLPGLSGQRAADLVAVAQSQVGYTQSDTNVKVDVQGRIQNYTRYGAWYGQPYDAWDAMFVSFCLHYANVPQGEFPLESNSYRWVMELQSRDSAALKQAEESATEAPAPLYAAASDHEPAAGDLVFFDIDANGNADRVGIVAELSGGMIKTIEGDTVNGCVEYQTYDVGAPAILGYGIVPAKAEETAEPVQVTLTAETDTVVATAVFAEGVFPADAVMTITPLPSTEEDVLAVESTLTGRHVEAMYRFDITFTDAAGNELEPNGNVAVSIQFAQPLTAAAAPAAEQAEDAQEPSVEWNLIHIPAEGDTENLTGQQTTVLETSEDNALESVQFESGGFSEYVVLALTADAQATETDLETYLAGSGGTLLYNLYDVNGNLLTSASGAIDVVIGEKYKLAFVVEAPNGIHPGDYYLQLPEGVTTATKSGTLVTEGEQIGTWEVDANGHISLHFSDAADNHQDILFSGEIEVVFEEVEEPIEIEGNVIVNPKPPADETGYMWKGFYYSYLYDDNWNIVTDDDGNQIPKSINWRITIYGSDGDMPVVGQTITDQLGNDGVQIYDPDEEPVSLEITLPSGVKHGNIVISTQANIDAGIFKWITDSSGNYVGWEYTVPETIACTGDECASGENGSVCKGDGTTVLTLADEDWMYYFRCESFPKEGNQFDPNVNYNNTVFKSDKPNVKYSSNTGTSVTPGVVKEGSYNSVKDQYDFTATITIPGGMLSSRLYIRDDMTVLDADGNNVVKVENTIKNLESVTMYIGEETYTIPFITVADSDARSAWFQSHQNYSATPYVLLSDTSETTTVDGETVTYQYDYEFWKWCDCTADTCPYGDCEAAGELRDGFCRCWDIHENVTLRFNYSVPAQELNSKYGGQGMELENDLELHWQIGDYRNGTASYKHVGDEPTVDIPSVITKTEKTRASSDNEYTAIFGITLNQMLQDWSLLDEVVLHDEMSKSLVYIPGTLVVTRGDDTTPLTIGEDYTFESVEGGHGFVVTLLNPQQSVYHMQYSAMVIREGIDISNPSYNNKAWITVDDARYDSNSIDSALTDFTFASKSYSVTVHKEDQYGTALEGIEFGLFAENGELIQKKTTDAEGNVTFMTSVTDGIIFQTHSKYYIQELTAKPGYDPDYTQYMFYFCEKSDCTEETEGVIHFGSTGSLTVENALGGYRLPNTGGMGTGMYSMGGLALMLSAAYLLLNKRKLRGKEANTSR